MKDTLGEVQSKIKELKSDEVLILVLMEDTLGEIEMRCENILGIKCLNPCFNGRYSRRTVRNYEEALAA